MMRPYKFRGKALIDSDYCDIEKGNWVYGGAYLDGYILNEITEATDEYIAIGDWFPVDPKTVGMWTGEVDKDGVEIYEGDVVRATSRYDSGNMVIVWDRGEFIQVLCENYATYQPGMGHYSIKNFVKEKIGNIYDNPELIAPDPDCQEGVCPL